MAVTRIGQANPRRRVGGQHRLFLCDASTGAGQDLTGLSAVVQLHSHGAFYFSNFATSEREVDRAIPQQCGM